MTPRVFLQAKKARPFFGRHPWVFHGAVGKVEGNPAPGDLVAVHTFEKEFIAWGLYNPASNIRVRLYSWEKDRPVDEELIVERIERAIRFRQETLGLVEPNAAYRLVYSESDALSGLIIDRFADVFVVQFTSRAMARYESTIIRTLRERFSPRGIYRRTEKGIGEIEDLQVDDALLEGDVPDEPIAIRENGLTFFVDVKTGQKTGAYLDQRENRAAVARLANGRSVLDVFCHGGGFGLTALKLGQATSMIGVDSSAAALSTAQRNAEFNGLSAEFIQEGAATALDRLRKEKRSFGMVVCDPPKFARTAGAVGAALKGYENLNRQAIDLLEPGGILVTCSCSGHVSSEQFREVVASAAQRVGRQPRLIEERGQAADHPVSLFCLETGYLKCLVVHVDG